MTTSLPSMPSLPSPTSLYHTATRLASRLPIPAGDLSASLTGRRSAAAFWEDWASRARGHEPLIWLHAASVGEALAAEPVLRRLRAARALQIILTHSSPSVEHWPGDLGVDARGFVPLDEPRSVERTLEALRPALLVFSRGDLWPALVAAAAARALPVAVIGAAVRERSRRLAWPLRRLLRGMHEALTYVGAVTEGDAERWVRLGVRPAAVMVAGDPRHDYVLQRRVDLCGLEHLLSWVAQAPVLVCGGTEEEDEPHLIEAFHLLATEAARPRVLMVPHDPGSKGLGRAVRRAGHAGIVAESWRFGMPEPCAGVVIVDSRGRLNDIYTIAAAAYVGGGFRSGGLHSVIEPAAMGVPVIVGPRWKDSPDARALIHAGGAVPLPETGSARALAAAWRHWFAPAAAWKAGVAARRTLHAGAAIRCAAALAQILQKPNTA